MSNIANKLNYLNETKVELKNNINLTGANISNNTTFRNYSLKLKDSLINILKGNVWNLFDNFETVEANGENFSLTNTYDRTLMKTQLKGNLSQNTVILPSEYTQVEYVESTGTQYIDTGVNADANLRVILDVAFTDISLGNQNIGAIKMDSTPASRYHLMTWTNNNTFRLYLNDSAVTIGNLDNNRHKFDINVPEGVCLFDNDSIEISNDIRDTGLNFWLFGRNSTSTIYCSKVKQWGCKMYYNNILVRDFIPCYRNSDNEIGLYDLVNNVFYTNQGTGNFTYNNIAVIPNPDYPQKVEIVKGNNTILINNKNFLKLEGNSQYGVTSSYNEETGLLSITGTATTTNNAQITTTVYNEIKAGVYTFSINQVLTKHIYIHCHNKYSKDWVNYTINAGETSSTITIMEDCDQYNIRMGVVNGTTYNIQLQMQLEKGENVTDFIPCKIQSYPINLPIGMELCKIENYQDYLYKNNNRWYKKKFIESVVLDGTWETVSINTSSENTTRVYFTGIQENPCKTLSSAIQICNMFIPELINSIDKEGVYAGTNKTAVVRLNKTRVGTTKTSINQYLNNNNIIIYYVIPEPLDIEITDINLINQLNMIEQARSYDEETNISQSNSDKPFIITAEAIDKRRY